MRGVAHGILVALIFGGVIAASALAYAAYEWADGPEFDAAEWREAQASGAEDLDDLASDAVESGELDGRTRRELRRMLGAPDHVTRARRAWECDIGF